MIELLIVSLIASVVIFRIAMDSKEFRGKVGEFIVNVANEASLDSTVYHQFKNILLPRTDGTTTEIDHLIVSKHGIFVIETKTKKNGWIYGTEHENEWTVTFKGGKSKMKNPLHQNYGHIKAVQAITGLPNDAFTSIIVFFGDIEFKTPMPENVFKGCGHIEYIKKHYGKRLTLQQVHEAKRAINKHRLADTHENRQMHIDNVNRKRGV